MNTHNKLFLISLGNIRFICWAFGREEAKRQAREWIGGDMERYVVSPLSEEGDRVRIAVNLSL